MEYNYHDYDWKEILSIGTELKVREGGRLTANIFYKTPQIVNIVGSSDNEIPLSDPHLPEEFAGLPTSVTIRGEPRQRDEPTETPVDIIHIIESIQRGDSEIL
jgi:hypothetical protein